MIHSIVRIHLFPALLTRFNSVSIAKIWLFGLDKQDEGIVFPFKKVTLQLRQCNAMQVNNFNQL